MAVSSYIPPSWLHEHRWKSKKKQRPWSTQNRRISYVGLHGKWSARQRFFSFPRCGGRCFLLIYHKHKLQMLHKCPRCLWFRQKNRLNCYKARTFQKFFEKWRKKRGSTRRPADPIRLFHRPHLFNQGLLFLSADCPYRQDQFHSEQYQNEQSHFQNRELIRHYISGKSSYTHFSASKDGSRKPNDQRRQCCKERIAQPLTDVHFTRRLRNATARINTAFFVTKLK